jgi:hypothetical protein
MYDPGRIVVVVDLPQFDRTGAGQELPRSGEITEFQTRLPMGAMKALKLIRQRQNLKALSFKAMIGDQQEV